MGFFEYAAQPQTGADGSPCEIPACPKLKRSVDLDLADPLRDVDEVPSLDRSLRTRGGAVVNLPARRFALGEKTVFGRWFVIC